MDGVVIRTTGHVAGGKTDKDIAQYAPYISPDTNTWWQYNKETQMFENTGIVPYGLKGEKGDPGDDYILTEEDKEEIIAAIRAMVVMDSDTVNGHTVEADVPEDAVFTDTTYDPATQSSTGLMSAQDKTRLDTLQTDALRKTAQTLSAAEKTQARTNIGAVSSSDVTTAVTAAKCLVVSGNVSSSSPTLSNSAITTDMVCVHCEVASSAMLADWTFNTDTAGKVTITPASAITATSTPVKIYLLPQR
jgi:hypothetical protein